MPDIHIERDHPFTLARAREVAEAWAAQAENELGMACHYTEGADEDLLTFSRSGVKGALRVSGQRFALDAQLGFLLGAFKDKIESEISRNLDRLLADHTPQTHA